MQATTLRKRTSAQARLQHTSSMEASEKDNSCSQEEDDEQEGEGEEEYSSEQGFEVQSQSDLTFLCPHNGCDKAFSRKIRLNAHMHLHYGT